MKTFVLADKDRFKMIPPSYAEVVESEHFAKSIAKTRDESLWITEDISLLKNVVSAWHATNFQHQDWLRKRVTLCILVDEILTTWFVTLTGLFKEAVVVSHKSSLPMEQLVEVCRSKSPERYVIGGQVDDVTKTITLTRGDLSSIVVPLSAFRPSGFGVKPDFQSFKVDDFGQTLRFGDYEASVDSILYEFDPTYRRKVKKERIKTDKGFGASLRRLRAQKGLRQSDFPDIDAREIGRIERGEVKPRKKTVESLARALGVSSEEIKSY